MPVSLVTPSTSVAISSPKCSRTSSSDALVSSTVSCSSAAHSVSVSRRRPAQIFATPTGWTMKSSPDLRRWSAWCSQAKRNASSTCGAVDGHGGLVGVLLDDREEVAEQPALGRREVGARDRRVRRRGARRGRPGRARSARRPRAPAARRRRRAGRRPSQSVLVSDATGQGYPSPCGIEPTIVEHRAARWNARSGGAGRAAVAGATGGPMPRCARPASRRAWPSRGPARAQVGARRLGSRAGPRRGRPRRSDSASARSARPRHRRARAGERLGQRPSVAQRAVERGRRRAQLAVALRTSRAKSTSGAPQARCTTAPATARASAACSGAAGGSSATTWSKPAASAGVALEREPRAQREAAEAAGRGARGAARASAQTTSTRSPEATSAAIDPGRAAAAAVAHRGRARRRPAWPAATAARRARPARRRASSSGSPTSAIGAGCGGWAQRRTSRGSTAPFHSLSSSAKVASSGPVVRRRAAPSCRRRPRARARRPPRR